MSPPELSADLNRWPEDPYELLGVSFGVPPRELRRAYTRLIRTYKPEQFPEHFRRIREAYETILGHVEMFGFGAPESSAEDERRPANDGEVGPDAGPGEPPPAAGVLPDAVWNREEGGGVPRPRLHSLSEELHELWERACRGEQETAYNGLLELQFQHPGKDDLYLRLYWLLTLFPELDALRSPCDWLTGGLHESGLTGPLRELYRREIEVEPEEALTERCALLLDGRASVALLTDVAGWRWQAASRLSRWEVIARDIQSLREPVLRQDEEAWVRLLLSAADLLAWEAPELMRLCCEEIERFPHLSVRLGNELDRLDLLRAVARGWQALVSAGPEPSALLRLIPASWTRPFAEVRPALLEFLGWIVRQPRAALAELDQINRRASAVLAQFGQLLTQFQYTLSSPPPEPERNDILTRLVLDFLDGLGRFKYAAMRRQLLDFCLAEAVAPEVIAEIVEGRPRYQLGDDNHLAHALTADWPLQYVCLAHRLFWA